MMNYEIFKEVVKEKFMDYMPDNFKGMELVVMPVEKVNMTYDGISIRGKDTNISPTIYINDMYEKYQNCGDLEETLMAACDLMAMEFAKTPQVVDVDSLYKDANEKVVFQLINTEQNRSFLEQVPHREFQDLSIIYSAEELVGTIASLTDKKKETSAEKSRIYKARERSRELFTAADEMENLKPAEQSYRLGDNFFEDEHRKWVALEQELQAQGYSLEEVQALRRHYKEEYSEVCAKEKVVFRELNTGKAILNSMIPDSISDGRKTEYNREIIRDRKEQPVR